MNKIVRMQLKADYALLIHQINTDNNFKTSQLNGTTNPGNGVRVINITSRKSCTLTTCVNSYLLFVSFISYSFPVTVPVCFVSFLFLSFPFVSFRLFDFILFEFIIIIIIIIFVFFFLVLLSFFRFCSVRLCRRVRHVH